MDRIQVAIKIRAERGCFCRSHSREANRLIDEYIRNNHFHDYEYHEHESGPEIIAWLALGTAGVTVTKSLIDLVTTIIKACKKGEEKGDNFHGKLLLIVRDTHKTETSTEEFVLEIYDKDIVSSETIQKAIETGVNKKFNKG